LQPTVHILQEGRQPINLNFEMASDPRSQPEESEQRRVCHLVLELGSNLMIVLNTGLSGSRTILGSLQSDGPKYRPFAAQHISNSHLVHPIERSSFKTRRPLGLLFYNFFGHSCQVLA
jgi:hypothetical protein